MSHVNRSLAMEHLWDPGTLRDAARSHWQVHAQIWGWCTRPAEGSWVDARSRDTRGALLRAFVDDATSQQ